MITKSGTQLAAMPETPKPSYVLQPHQQRVVSRLDKSPGLLAYHSLGSGKTLTSLIAAQHAIKANRAAGNHDPALFVVPASLQDNIGKEIAKHKIGLAKDDYRVMTYDRAVRELPEMAKHRYAISVLDEAHKLRSMDTARYKAMRQLAAQSDRRLLLTASPSYHQPSDLAPLVNMAAGSKVLPGSPEEFDKKYMREATHNPSLWNRIKGERSYKYQEMKDTDKLVGSIRGYVDRHNSEKTNPGDFPTVKRNTVEVEMSPEQTRLYNFLSGKMPKMLEYKIKAGLPLSKQESKNLNAFAGAVRQVSDSTVPYNPNAVSSPKLDAAVRRLRHKMGQDPNFRGVVYANFLQAGLDPYSKQLDHFKIPYHKFTGSLSRKEKNSMVEDFNSANPKAKVLLLSSSGGEGLDLKGVRYQQLLDPHWNDSKLQQVTGRAVRYKSHAHLPENQRNVEVDQYLSVKPKTLMNRWFGTKRPKAIEEYLTSLSAQKEQQIAKIRDGLERES